MKCFVLPVFTIILSCFCVVSAQTSSPNSVFQSWNEIQIIVPLVKGKDSEGKSFDRVTATFGGVARVGRKSFDFLDDRAGIVLDFRVGKHISLFAGALYRRDEVVKNVVRYEKRFGAGATFSAVWKKFTFKDRNLFEHRFRNGRSNADLYRQRIQISRPLKFRKKVIFTPFISEEVYYSIRDGVWVQNEFYAGISRKLNALTTLDIAYLRNDSKPVNVNGINLVLKIKVK